MRTSFYYQPSKSKERLYLFTTEDFSGSVFAYFRDNGRCMGGRGFSLTIKELYEDRKMYRNPKIGKIFDRLPGMIDYVLRENAEQKEQDKHNNKVEKMQTRSYMKTANSQLKGGNIMKNNQQKTTRLSSLKKGKVKRIGFFEKIGLKISGYADGKRNLPRDGVSGWMSPHLDKEVRSYDEFASRMWGRLQVEEEENYARLGELMDSIAHTKSLLDEAKSALDGAETKEKSADNSRKKGEAN